MERMGGKFAAADLGMCTTYTAYMDCVSKMGVCCVSQEGGNAIPSVISFEDKDTVLVGQLAKENQILAPKRTAAKFKRLMGTDQTVLCVDGKEYKAKDLMTILFKYALENTEGALERKLKHWVLTVPLEHEQAARQDLIDAGKKAGAEEIRLLYEVTAPIYHYESKGILKGRFLILDYGGSTLGIAGVEVKDDAIDIAYVDGDGMNGGSDYDEAIVAYLKETYLKGKTLNDYDEQKLYADAENAKCALSKKMQTRIVLSYEEGKESVVFTREEFEQCTAHLLAEVEEKLRRFHSQMEVDKVYLVGGASKMFSFQQLVKDIFQEIPIVCQDPDEAVARGAAVYAQMLSDGEKTLETTFSYRTKQVNMISPHSYGVEVQVGEDGEKKVFNMILKGTQLPVTASKDYYTKDDTSRVTLRIYESRSEEEFTEPSSGHLIGTAYMEAQEQLPRHTKICTSLMLDETGTLHLFGEEPEHHVEVKAEWKLNL